MKAFATKLIALKTGPPQLCNMNLNRQMKTLSTQIFLLFFVCFATAQGSLGIRLDTSTVAGLPGLHSFAAAQHEGKWLLIGGRKDGLHPKNGGFQTSAANQQ